MVTKSFEWGKRLASYIYFGYFQCIYISKYLNLWLSIQRFELSQIFECFWKLSLILTKALFTKKYSKNSNIVKWIVKITVLYLNVF